DQAGVVLLITRNDVPRGDVIGLLDGPGVGLVVLIPLLLHAEIAGGVAPALRRVAQAGEEVLGLELRGDVQQNLDDAGAVGLELLLEATDGVVAAVDFLDVAEPLHAGDQNIFVVGAVEDRDLAVIWQLAADAGKEVAVVGVVDRLDWFREGGDVHTLRGHGLQDGVGGAALT